MTVIGGLTVEVGGNATPFEKAIERVKQKISELDALEDKMDDIEDTLDRTSTSQISSITTIGATVGTAVAAVGAAWGVVNSTMKEIANDSAGLISRGVITAEEVERAKAWNGFVKESWQLLGDARIKLGGILATEMGVNDVLDQDSGFNNVGPGAGMRWLGDKFGNWLYGSGVQGLTPQEQAEIDRKRAETRARIGIEGDTTGMEFGASINGFLKQAAEGLGGAVEAIAVRGAGVKDGVNKWTRNALIDDIWSKITRHDKPGRFAKSGKPEQVDTPQWASWSGNAVTLGDTAEGFAQMRANRWMEVNKDQLNEAKKQTELLGKINDKVGMAADVDPFAKG